MKLEHRRRRRAHRQRGLTLIEILVVVTILGIISGIIGINVVNALEQARIDSTKVQMKNIEDGLENYKMRFHAFPSTVEGLAALAQPKSGLPVMTTIPKDAWDNDYIYTFPGRSSPRSYDIVSKGPDGVADTDDDIGSRGHSGAPMARAP